MFFASVGHELGAGVDVFGYYLADRLGKTLSELDDMPASEYAGWRAFHKVRNQQEELGMLRAKHG